MSAAEAIAKFVHDGDQLIIGNYTLGMACGLIYEIVRQGKKGLTHCSQSGHVIDEVLVAGGCVDRLVTAFVLNAGGSEGGSAVGRAWKQGRLQIEDYTNYNYNARLMAGMHGFAFMPVFEGILHTDLFRKRSFMGEDKYRVIKCPFTGRDTVLVPALNPDVCVIHVQRADKFGNAQYWGAMGSVQAAALASKRLLFHARRSRSLWSSWRARHLPIHSFRWTRVFDARGGAIRRKSWDTITVTGWPGFLLERTVVGGGHPGVDGTYDLRCRDHNDYLRHYVERFGLEPFMPSRRAPSTPRRRITERPIRRSGMKRVASVPSA
jgi:glutaconate CoA-transferase subunit A